MARIFSKKSEVLQPFVYSFVGFASCVIFACLFFFIRRPDALPKEDSYAGSKIFLSSLSEILYYAKLNFDSFVLVFFLSFMLLYLIFSNSSYLAKRAGSCSLFLVLSSFGYLTFFAFLWIFKPAYYTLPIAAWNAILVSLIAHGLLSTANGGKSRYVAIASLVSVMIFTRLYSVPTFYNSAVASEAWNTVNFEMLHDISDLPKGSQVLFNFDEDFQYYVDIERLLHGALYDRSDISLGSIFDEQDINAEGFSGKYIYANFGLESNKHVYVRGMQPPTKESFDSWKSLLGDVDLVKTSFFESRKTIYMPFSFRERDFELIWVRYDFMDF